MKQHITLKRHHNELFATYADGTPVTDRAVLDQISFIAYEEGTTFSVTIADETTGKTFRPNEIIVNIKTNKLTF